MLFDFTCVNLPLKCFNIIWIESVLFVWKFFRNVPCQLKLNSGYFTCNSWNVRAKRNTFLLLQLLNLIFFEGMLEIMFLSKCSFWSLIIINYLFFYDLMFYIASSLKVRHSHWLHDQRLWLHLSRTGTVPAFTQVSQISNYNAWQKICRNVKSKEIIWKNNYFFFFVVVAIIC